jgi:hypothetical protein
MQHAGHLDIPDMQRPPGNFWVRVFSPNRLPYDRVISHHMTSLILIAPSYRVFLSLERKVTLFIGNNILDSFPSGQ